MKYSLFAIAMSVSLYASAQNLKFEGTLAGLTGDTKVILSDMMNVKFNDTASVSTDRFILDTKLPGAGLYVLRVGLVGKSPEHRVLYLDSGTVKLAGKRGNLKAAELTGQTNYMKDWLKFDRIIQNDPILALQNRQTDTLIILAGKTGSYDGAMADTGFVRRSSETFPLADAKKTELAKAWLVQNPDSDINAYIIYKYLRWKLTDEELKRAIAQLNLAARKSLIGKILLSRVH
ncbi:DUF4369 domain-containing protein [Pedobacter sp. KBS0701]|uniref:DUF4369 domain-containing protein n=1 Tax=Pedobacter sp. KBS0701 TaxID=2578106 RepID=UPI00110E4816|nr:DUF4369 domain-containing protein [Pedobacter sp. KBS0701]QDW24149.1 DUF4369 domain-containing protein [Pedobacter sp. KBS0701]